jgi:acyl-coenzyme A synthetase/AMP-(fatty) acid ligase
VGCIHRGRLYVCGRTKDMIKVRGCAVALSELDQCVAAALCGTAAEVCCLAAPEEAVTVIVQGAGSDCEGRQLSALLRSRFGVCANVRTVPSRPRLIVRTASGKLNRAATRERCRSAGIVDA